MTDADWDTAKAVYWGRDEVDEKVFVAAKKESPFVKKKSFSIRNIETRRISVMFENQKIDDLDIAQAFFYVHPGAVHNIQGVEYRVVDLSLPTNTATVVKASHSFFTRPSDSTTVTPVVPVVQSKGGFLHRGRVDVALKVKGFYRMSKKPPHELIDGGYEALELPAIKYATCAVWIDLAKVGIDPLLSVSAAHGASHAIFYSACQRLLLSKQSDIKCDCQNQNNSIMIFDSQNGGLGISDMIFNRLASLIHIAIGRITKCQCSEGCIKCLFLSSCSEGNRELRKTETIEFLNQLMEKVDSIHE
jgi:DEAD/DEAH box helicase domain-containing protein